jgi:hypothetical protein
MKRAPTHKVREAILAYLKRLQTDEREGLHAHYGCHYNLGSTIGEENIEDCDCPDEEEMIQDMLNSFENHDYCTHEDTITKSCIVWNFLFHKERIENLKTEFKKIMEEQGESIVAWSKRQEIEEFDFVDHYFEDSSIDNDKNFSHALNCQSTDCRCFELQG